MSIPADARQARLARNILDTPLHQACGLELLSSAAGHSEIRFAVNDFSRNVIGTLHGGITYAMIDVAAFMALASVMPEGQHGVTVDIQVSVLRAANLGESVYVRGRVDKVGRTLANLRSEAFVKTPEGERLIATGTVVKAMIPAPYSL